ncbi:MAG: trypsin-like peptidase domain-containing protein [Treponema sp.]
MKKKFIRLLTAVFLLTCPVNVFSQEALKPKIVTKLRQNVFEVVVKKIENDPLSYEKELPLDRIPYQLRIDKFESIGTAFLLKDGHFYTAAHVLDFIHLTQMDEFFIRSSEGKIYEIGNILKFSTNRDFVSFDVIGFDDPDAKGLDLDTSYKINSSVFAVGNAQGEGIVIRNGLLTSKTPEHRNGEWNWLRFSAAASPGNSGGPLVTSKGNVIGIVTMKNSSENLNYALPVSEIAKVPDSTGIISMEMYYNLPNIMTQKFYHTLDTEISLPKPIKEVRDTSYGIYSEDSAKLVKDITKDYKYSGKESFVTKDPGNNILNGLYEPNFPYTISLNEKGKWGCYYPQNVSTLKLENNGAIHVGSMFGSIIMSYLKKPDNVSIEEYIKNPKLLMDTLEKAFVMNRQVGSERITITSYGEPASMSSHKDCLGRTWIISAYNVPFADSVVYSYSLPLPDGIYSMTVIASTSDVWNGFCYDFEFLSDFVLTKYSGTVKDWVEYLKIPEKVYPRHEVLKNSNINRKADKTEFELGNLQITCPAEILKINDTTDLNCSVVLRADKNKNAHLEILSATIDTDQNTNDNTAIWIAKQYQPDESAAKDITDTYKKIVSKTIPYNGEPYEENQSTIVFLADTAKEDYVKVLMLFYKGSKTDIIKNNAKIFNDSFKVK